MLHEIDKILSQSELISISYGNPKDKRPLGTLGTLGIAKIIQ